MIVLILVVAAVAGYVIGARRAAQPGTPRLAVERLAPKVIAVGAGIAFVGLFLTWLLVAAGVLVLAAGVGLLRR